MKLERCDKYAHISASDGTISLFDGKISASYGFIISAFNTLGFDRGLTKCTAYDCQEH